MRRFSLLFAGVLSAAALGCTPEPPKVPNPTRTLDERRAIEVIRRAIQAEGAQPAAARDEQLTSSKKSIRIDVGVDGKQYGIAYLTDDNRSALDGAYEPKKDGNLQVPHAGPTGNIRIVFLFQTNYRYDDLVGEGHEQTTITAESQLARDVRDFITYARTQKFD